MEYPGYVAAKLRAAGACVGDIVSATVRGFTFEGAVMPHHDFSGENILILKLGSGYNAGVELDDGSSVALVEKGTPHQHRAVPLSHEAGRPSVSIIATGGTIASYIDYRTGAVHPALSADELAASLPELSRLCNIRTRVLFSLLSENILPSNWQAIAREISSEFKSGADGVIVLHGTDTMAYTAAALSFMLGKLPGPVVLVGAQRSSDRPSSDAAMNLLAAARVAISDLGEVAVVMHASASDGAIAIHRGSRVRKMHSSRRDAFESPGALPLGMVEGDKVIWLSEYRKKTPGEIIVKDHLEQSVSLLYFYPGFDAEHFRHLAGKCRGIVIAGTGLGHVSENLLEPIREATTSGKTVVMTTQCIDGSVDLKVYSTGRDLQRAGVVPGGDMLPEVAYVKLMWVLGHTDSSNAARALMETDISGELGSRRRAVV